MKNFEDFFDSSILNKDHDLIGNRNKNMIDKLKIQTPKNVCIDEFVCLRSNDYSFKRNDKNTNKKNFLNLSQNIISLDNVKSVQKEKKDKKIVGKNYFDSLIMKCIFRR